jgi:hypothetical protein
MKWGLNDKMSPRELVAEALRETCVFGGLTDAYGVIKTRTTGANGKKYWNVTFCKAVNLDGEIRVYSEHFILIKWQTRYKSLPAYGQQRFTSETEAKAFLCSHFINK